MYNIICEMNRQSRFDGLIQDAWGWCTGMTQRDGMGREVGGGFSMGNMCAPWWIHVDVWQNQYNNCKVISLQLK